MFAEYFDGFPGLEARIYYITAVLSFTSSPTLPPLWTKKILRSFDDGCFSVPETALDWTHGSVASGTETISL